MDGYKKFQSANNVICIKGLNPDRFKNVGKYAKLLMILIIFCLHLIRIINILKIFVMEIFLFILKILFLFLKKKMNDLKY